MFSSPAREDKVVRSSGRSYYTYRQIVLRAIIELEQDSARHGHSFHTKTIRNKVRDFACAEDVHLGEYWHRHVTRAAAALLEENVLRKAKQRGYVGLSPKGRKRLAGSYQRYGSLDKLSPFKKSQFLKAVAVISTRSRSTSSPDNNLPQKCRMQEELIASLRASITQVENKNQRMSTMLEETRQERDDLELSLRDLDPSLMPPFESDSMEAAGATPGLILGFDPRMTSTFTHSHPQLTARSNRDSSPGPIPMEASSPIAPVTRRPITTFAHRSSGSFLNTVSNQFTPSPSSSPGPAVDNAATVSGLTPLNDGQSSDGGNDFDIADLDDADMDLILEFGADGERDTEVGFEAMQQKEVELGDTLDKTRDLEANLAAAEKNTIALTETAQQLAATLQERDAMNTQLASMTRECDGLRRSKVEVEAALQDREQEISGLHNALAVVVQERDILQTSQTSLQGQWDALDLDRESERARVSAELGNCTREVSALNARVDALAAQLQQSNSRRDDAINDLDTTTSQLEATESLLQSTRAQLVATDAQLGGVQSDLRMVWKELQASDSLRIAAQAQLDSAHAQFQSTRAELDVANVRLDSTTSHLHTTAAQLQASNTQLDATNAQLAGSRADLQAMRGELQISNAQRAAAETQLESTSAELHAMNAQLNGVCKDLQQAWHDLMASNAELHATDAQLNGVNAKIQTLRIDLEQAHDRQEGLGRHLRETTLDLDATRLELKQMTNEAVDRERFLESQLEDAQERVAIAQEDLARIRAAWSSAEEKRRIAADAEEEVRQMLFSDPGPKRDPSFRDSGVSIAA